jgi:hypothetical protein
MRQSRRMRLGNRGTRSFPAVLLVGVTTAVVAWLAAAPEGYGEMIALNWQFNETLSDASGTGNGGTYYAVSGSPVYGDGLFGKAIDLNPQQMVYRGLTTAVPSAGELHGLPVAAADAWTVNLWSKLDNPNPTTHTLLGGFGSDPGGASLVGTKRFLRVRSDAGPVNAMSFWGNSTGYDYDLKSPTVPTTVEYPDGDGWHMVTATFSGGTGGTLAMYLDGDLIGSVARTFKDAPGSGGILVARVGSDTKTPPVSTNTLDGKIDDFSIWSVGLTGGEVKAISNVPTCGVSELTGYDSLTMEKLIGVYRSAGAKSATVGPLTWDYVTGLSGHAPGDIWETGGARYVQFGADSGVVAVPEPAAVTLFLLGLAAAAAANWRSRQR